MEPTWRTIERHYDFSIHEATLIREQIGRVYRLDTDRATFALKWYRTGWDDVAVRAAQVMAHLNQSTPFAPVILPTVTGDLTSIIDGTRVVLWEWVDGEDVDKETDADSLFALWEGVNRAMAEAPFLLPKRRWSDSVKRYCTCLFQTGWSEERSFVIQDMSRAWMDAVDTLPQGFQHGDFHTGNVLKTSEGLVLLDFDACGEGVSMADLATMYDGIPFHDCTKEAMERTVTSWRQRFDPDPAWIRGLLAVLPLRHMEIIANILMANGMSVRDHALFDKQHKWMRRFHDIWGEWPDSSED